MIFHSYVKLLEGIYIYIWSTYISINQRFNLHSLFFLIGNGPFTVVRQPFPSFLNRWLLESCWTGGTLCAGIKLMEACEADGRHSLSLVPAAEKPEIDWILYDFMEYERIFFGILMGYKRNYLRNEWDTLTSDLIFKFVMLCLKMGLKPSHMIIRLLFEWYVFNEICDAPATLGVPHFQTNPNGGFPMVVKNP